MRELWRVGRLRVPPAIITAVVAVGVLTGCSPNNQDDRDSHITLTSFDSCDAALESFKEAGQKSVSARGLPDISPFSTRSDTLEAEVSERASANDKDYSGTNTHEKGVDEPDIVKNTSQRIYTVSDNTLRVIDTDSRTLTGTLDLAATDEHIGEHLRPTQLLHYGDKVLVVAEGAITKVLLVNVEDEPTVTSSLTIEGEHVDARQTGSTVRLVARSRPRLDFVQPSTELPEREAVARNRDIIAESTIDDWLPQYESRSDTESSGGHVACSNVAHPAEYSGGTMLSVFTLTFGDDLGSGNPVTIAADGATVYASTTTLYVANQRIPAIQPHLELSEDSETALSDIRTELYAFDITGSKQPKYISSGWIPGTLLNQYSMSEYNGHLRIATTSTSRTVRCCNTEPGTESSVYVLKRTEKSLTQVGSVSGLGKGEEIYAVRFIGTRGYVVTFRQIDPLYTVDISDPTSPKVVGELKITGYSSYLHSANDTTLIGIGQEASEQGLTLGTQVSLFDVSDLATPNRVAQYHVRNTHSEAEFDPHAFLYWPDNGLLVVPITSARTVTQVEPDDPDTSATRAVVPPNARALVLRVEEDSELTVVGTITHPRSADGAQIQRSVIIDDTLWTISSAGAMASSANTLRQLDWIAF